MELKNMNYYYITGNTKHAIAYTDSIQKAENIFYNKIVDDILSVKEIDKNSIVLGYIPLAELLEFRDVRPHTIFWDSSINIR